MTQTHTPGPWTAGASLIGTLTMREIALVREPCRHRDGTPWTRNGAAETMAEYEANVALIAAAPDLLAALKDAQFLLAKCGINWKEAASMADSMKRSAADAAAAIAKAEGRS